MSESTHVKLQFSVVAMANIWIDIPKRAAPSPPPTPCLCLSTPFSLIRPLNRHRAHSPFCVIRMDSLGVVKPTQADSQGSLYVYPQPPSHYPRSPSPLNPIGTFLQLLVRKLSLDLFADSKLYSANNLFVRLCAYVRCWIDPFRKLFANVKPRVVIAEPVNMAPTWPT